MKKLLLPIVGCLFYSLASAQQALPAKAYNTIKDSITNIDVTLYRGGSLSMEGKSARSFANYFENKTTAKDNTPAQGMIMWQINGREFISGKIFLGDTSGYVVTVLDNKEYVNIITRQGTQFFKDRIKH